MGSPEAAALPIARELTAAAMRRLLRGGTYEALAREIAWRASDGRAPGAFALQSLAELLESELAARIASVEVFVARAGASARAQHLERWPIDLPGAELAARWTAEEEAAQAVTRLYADVLAWARELVPAEPRRRRLFARLRERRERRAPRPELPALAAEELGRRRQRYGWSSRRRAVPAPTLRQHARKDH